MHKKLLALALIGAFSLPCHAMDDLLNIYDLDDEVVAPNYKTGFLPKRTAFDLGRPSLIPSALLKQIVVNIKETTVPNPDANQLKKEKQRKKIHKDNTSLIAAWNSKTKKGEPVLFRINNEDLNAKIDTKFNTIKALDRDLDLGLFEAQSLEDRREVYRAVSKRLDDKIKATKEQADFEAKKAQEETNQKAKEAEVAKKDDQVTAKSWRLFGEKEKPDPKKYSGKKWPTVNTNYSITIPKKTTEIIVTAANIAMMEFNKVQTCYKQALTKVNNTLACHINQMAEQIKKAPSEDARLELCDKLAQMLADARTREITLSADNIKLITDVFNAEFSRSKQACLNTLHKSSSQLAHIYNIYEKIDNPQNPVFMNEEGLAKDPQTLLEILASKTK